MTWNGFVVTNITRRVCRLKLSLSIFRSDKVQFCAWTILLKFELFSVQTRTTNILSSPLERKPMAMKRFISTGTLNLDAFMTEWGSTSHLKNLYQLCSMLYKHNYLNNHVTQQLGRGKWNRATLPRRNFHSCTKQSGNGLVGNDSERLFRY